MTRRSEDAVKECLLEAGAVLWNITDFRVQVICMPGEL